MIVISTRDFRANQSKFMELANKGEDIILKSRKNGSFKLVPVSEEDSLSATKRDVILELKDALQQVKDHLDGKRKMGEVDTLIDELRDNIL